MPFEPSLAERVIADWVVYPSIVVWVNREMECGVSFVCFGEICNNTTESIHIVSIANVPITPADCSTRHDNRLMNIKLIFQRSVCCTIFIANQFTAVVLKVNFSHGWKILRTFDWSQNLSSMESRSNAEGWTIIESPRAYTCMP